MATASWIIEQQRAEAEVIDRYHQLDAVITRVSAEEQRLRITSEALSGHPNCNGAVALQRANDLRQLIENAKYIQSNLDRMHLIEMFSRRERRIGGGR